MSFKWNELNDVDFKSYGFIPPNSDSNFWGSNQISIKVGDHDLNGYLDLLVIVRDNKWFKKYFQYKKKEKLYIFVFWSSTSSKKTEKFAALMNNVASSSPSNRTFSRTFKMATSLNKLLGHTNVVQASFFDIAEDVLLFFKFKKLSFD